MPALDRLAADLATGLPTSGPATLVHGDYRLDNTVLDPAQPGRIAAVLDWEMSTLGDPLADVGLLLVYWSDPDDAGARTDAMVTPAATAHEGFPRRRDPPGLPTSGPATLVHGDYRLDNTVLDPAQPGGQ